MENQIKITSHRQSHDVVEQWACVEYLSNDGDLLATDDGQQTHYYSGATAQTLSSYLDTLPGSRPDPDFAAYDKALTAYRANRLRDERGDEWVVIRNSYESETSCGFANTYYIVSASEGDKSRYGWQMAKQVKDIGTNYDAELVAWAGANYFN